MAGLDPAIQSLRSVSCLWMAASTGGHDDGIGGNIRVIKSRKCAPRVVRDRYELRLACFAIPARASLGRDHSAANYGNALLASGTAAQQPLSSPRSNYANRFHAQMPVPSQYDVIVDDDAKLRRNVDDLLRHVHIGLRRRGIAGRMIVREDDRRRR